jgi:hypothetical protein
LDLINVTGLEDSSTQTQNDDTAQTSPEQPSDTEFDINNVIDAFWIEFEGTSFHVQNHGNHNFSCWKNHAEICRFKLPAHAWNQISGIIQLELIKGLNESDAVTFGIRSSVQGASAESHLSWGTDRRCLMVAMTKRSSDEQILRDPTNPTQTGINVDVQWQENTDEGRNNGLMGP